MTGKFFQLYSNTPSGNTKSSENEKVSYWLEKLYKQGEEKNLTRNVEKQTTDFDYRMQASPFSQVSTPRKTPEEKGIDEHTKNQIIKTEADRQSIDELVKSSNRCVLSISSLFPWDFFPNTINIEESRVTFIFRQFLASQSHSVDINDISNVFIESSFLFSTLQVVSRTYIQNDIKIGYLNKKKAIKARMIIEGLRTLARHNLNTSSYEVDELILKIEEMHSSQGGEIN